MNLTLETALINGAVMIALATALGATVKLLHMGLQKWVLKTVGKPLAKCPDNSCKEKQVRDQEEFKEALRTEMSDGFDKLGTKIEEGLNRVHSRIDVHLNKAAKEAPTT